MPEESAVNVGKAVIRETETDRDPAVSRETGKAVREAEMVRPGAVIREAETDRDPAAFREDVRAVREETISLAQGVQLPVADLHLIRMVTADAPLVVAGLDREISSVDSSRVPRDLAVMLPSKIQKSIEKKKRGVSVRRRISAIVRITCMKRMKR